MEFEVGKEYVSDDYGVSVKVTEVDANSITYVVTNSDNFVYTIGSTSIIYKNTNFVTSLRPRYSTEGTEGTEGTKSTEGNEAPVPIKTYDYFRLPLHTQYLHSYINAFLRIYNTVSIQKTADYYILLCERLEKE